VRIAIRTSVGLTLAAAGLAATMLPGASAAPPAAGAVDAGAAPAAVMGAPGAGTHVVAVGDIAYPGGPYAETAALVAELDPARLLLAGDIAYQSGSAADFATRFDPDWGRFRSMILPVPGNHEYRTRRAAGYREYFSDRGGLYWSRKVGSWRVIGLDSERVGSTKQRKWLRRTLKKHNGTPTLVMWHRPRYSRGDHSDQRDTAALYRLVKRDRDVKLLVWGHDHDYERMEIPVRGRGSRLPAFVVGTGGAELRCDTTNGTRRWSRVFDCTNHGVLDLRLGSRSFGWAFVTLDGTVTDEGTWAW
jgi:3',5'-cyclic AMP phosphodiesterase CpdA